MNMAIDDSTVEFKSYLLLLGRKHNFNILKKTLKNLAQKNIENYTRYVMNAGYLCRFKLYD